MERRAPGLASGAPLPFPAHVRSGKRRPLPQLPDHLLPGLCAALTPQEAAVALANRMLPVNFSAPAPGYAVADRMAAAAARRMGCRVVARVDGQALGHALTRRFGPEILRLACFGLAQRKPELSASRLVRPGKMRGVFLLACLAGLAALALPWLATLMSFLIFVPIAALRLLSLLAPVVPRPGRVRLPDSALPVYTVLVALYREGAVLPQLVRALCQIDYPADRLDVKLVIEADDTETESALSRLVLPSGFEIIRVPPAAPRTKPKALNYALAFARGELVTIYDAEDIPDARQLRLAAETFAAAGPELACLQARLTIYNARRNWLTGQFALEYAMLFDLLLPFLAWLKLPIPLGGTSNHFRADVLRDMGAWDPFNVTEDADLGLRLARAGYATGVLASSTHEEAPSSLRNWMQQRARWLKGWVQTWAVQSRNPREAIARMGFTRFATSQVLMAGTFLAALLYAPLTLQLLFSAMTGQAVRPGASAAELAGLLVSLFVFTSGHVFMMVAAAQAGLIRFHRVQPALICSLPAYWMLISAAAWLALWQLFRRPFHWNKTRHGAAQFFRSRMQNKEKKHA